MSINSIHKYHLEVEKLKHFGGSKKETAIRNPFYNLLNEYARQQDLVLVPEISIKTPAGKVVTPDGTLKDMLRQDWGYWESKDEADNLDEEINKKFAKGYPNDNILFEDSRTAVLIQNGQQVMRVSVKDEEALDRLLIAFVGFERPEVRNFRDAIDKFKEDVPIVTEAIHNNILEAEKSNTDFTKKLTDFLNLCRESINPNITRNEIYEMLIQHILTEDIFNTIFDETAFHRENNVAHELESVISTFFAGATRKNILSRIKHYYDTIKAAAAGIADHHEKQKFLKVVYESFYKSYNPKAADRLGVVYTPNEIVRFMIESTDYLLHKYFDRYLEDPDVEILDPATGTGTFICDIIDYIRAEKLEYKYRNEIHANEVAILPYYISNLNIEYTYKQKMNQYLEFEHLCFVDTLDNVSGLRDIHSDEWLQRYGEQGDLFAVNLENSARIKSQNTKKLSVIIGNPPYNANQVNENDNNKNRTYSLIDKRIKDTFIKESTAQKTKLYDMYARFYRWAFDRLNDNGIVTFVTNNSFINAKAFDGFRKCIQNEFQYAYIIDLGGNIRDLSGKDGIFLNEKHTIFGKSAMVGIAIMFLVKKRDYFLPKCEIRYIHPNDIRATRDEKLQWLNENQIEKISFEIIRPDPNNNWINIANNDFEKFLPLAGKNAVFEFTTLGISTNRDEWVLDFDETTLKRKIKYFIQKFNTQVKSGKNDDADLDLTIKWSASLKSYLKRRVHIKFEALKIRQIAYRPFTTKNYYSESKLSDRLTANHVTAFGTDLTSENCLIAINANDKDFRVLASPILVDLHFTGDSQCLPLYRYDASGNRKDNITDWGLLQFVKHYNDESITKLDVFHYVYAVLHYPAYRHKYELNLKRDFPHIPFYDDFKKWTTWGKKLMDLHINYETIHPYPLQRKDCETTEGQLLKTKLKADKSIGVIVLDDATELEGIPEKAWDYKLGNRSALEWVLDQYKESKPTDQTIAELFNTYRFADYKEQVIDLLKRVCTVSVKTIQILDEMME